MHDFLIDLHGVSLLEETVQDLTLIGNDAKVEAFTKLRWLQLQVVTTQYYTLALLSQYVCCQMGLLTFWLFSPQRNMLGPCGPRKTFTGAAIVCQLCLSFLPCHYILGVCADPTYTLVQVFLHIPFRQRKVIDRTAHTGVAGMDTLTDLWKSRNCL